ncbi:MAG: RNA polymerase sigma factor [Saprospiraceae bacterium]
MSLLRFLLALLGKGNPKTITDEEAIHKYLETQRSFYFDLIYERYAPKIFGKSLSLMNDEALAQDCTQEIMMKILLNLSKFNFQSKFSTWVYSITYNFCIDKIRKRKKNPSIAVDDFSYFDREDNEIADRHLKEVKLERLKIILEVIPISDKAILLMKYMDGLSIKEISDIISKSESAVKMKLKRAKEKFVVVHNKRFEALEV